MAEQTPFQFYIQTIGRGQKRRRTLSQQEARDAMRMILRGEVTDMQLGAFLMLVRVREETPQEAAGFVEAIRETFETPVSDITVDIDWGSYAGKRRQLPWYLLAIELLVQRGYKVALHGIVGNDEARLYTQPVIEALGWRIADNLPHSLDLINEDGRAYIPIESFAPQVKTLMNHRQEIGLRSPVHTVARMLNPLNASLSVHGVFHKGYDDLHQHTAQLLSESIWVDQSNPFQTLAFCGDAGEPEVRPDKATPIKAVKNHQAWEFLMPKTFLDADPTRKALDVSLLLDVWHNKQSYEYGEASVIQTLAMNLMVLESLPIDEALEIAREVWQQRAS